MSKRLLFTLFALGGLLTTSPAAIAEMPGETEADTLVQTGAVKAVDDMTAFMRTLKQFTVVATTETDDILDNGQLVEITGVTSIAARIPDRLRVTVANDKQDRIYIYD